MILDLLRVALFVAILSLIHRAEALSTTPSRQFIQLTNPLAASVDDRLPSSFVSNWPTWVLDQNGDFSKIRDADGFVSPSSIDELWQAVDLKQPEIRLSLGLHVRAGAIHHVMPAVDVSFDGKHRNRGMCSVPRAFTWLDFQGMPLDEWNTYELVLATRKTDSEEEDSAWENLVQSRSIKGALNDAINLVTERPPEELGCGSHIIHVVVGEAIECPKAGSELRVLLKVQEEADVLGALQVKIVKIMAGSESEYLPEVYKPLFQDESLRRQAYVEFKKRMAKINNTN